MSQDTNPLLTATGHPRFAEIRAEHVEPAVRRRIAEADELLEKLLAQPGTPTWERTLAPLDEADERLARAWDPVEQLVHVLHDDAMRAAHRKVQPVVAEHGTRRLQNERLWRAVQAIRRGWWPRRRRPGATWRRRSKSSRRSSRPRRRSSTIHPTIRGTTGRGGDGEAAVTPQNAGRGSGRRTGLAEPASVLLEKCPGRAAFSAGPGQA